MKGKSILVLRPSHQTDDIEAKLRALEADPISAPAIEIGPPQDWGPVDRAIEHLAGFDWVLFTSVNGVTSVAGRAQESGSYDRLRNSLDDGPRVGAVGPATAEAITQALRARAWKPSSFTTEAFSEELPTSGERVLVFRAASADHRLEEILSGRGFEVVRADAYSTDNADPQPIRDALDEGVDAVLVTSASIARAFARASVQGPAKIIEATIASIGPATTRECQKQGIEVDVEASEHTTAGLIEALATYFADNP